MKYFTKYNKVFLALALILTVGSCTKDFEEMNTSPNSPTDVPAINIFTNVLVSHFGYEMGGWIQHTYLGCWSQQWCKVQYIDEDKYQPRDMSGDQEGRYTGPLLDLQIIINKTTEAIDAGNNVAANQALLAAAKITMVWIYSELTDLFGDIAYSEALQGLMADGILAAPYDTQESIYMDFFTKLEEANTLLDLNFVVNFGSGDVAFGGNPAAWKRFGNSLRLRLLNRTAGTPWSFTYNMAGTGAFTTSAGAAAYAGADAAIAAILNDPTGHPIMESNDDNFKLDYPGLPYRNPIYNTLFSRTDQGISETMIDFLNARNDPRVHIYAQPTPNSVADGTPVYTGFQNGRAIAAADFTVTSLLGTTVCKDEYAPLYGMCVDEVEFIKAEHYMRVGGAAQAAYEAGIAFSMERWGCIDGGTVSPTYFDNGVQTMPVTQSVDYAAYLAQPSVAFGSAADDGERYQRIIEQRWAAMFGQGVQAYTLVRRTGFPARTFEFMLEGAFYPGLGLPIRVQYSLNEVSYNPTNLQAAKNRQNVEESNEGMFSTNGISSQVWWHTRKNPIPTVTDVK